MPRVAFVGSGVMAEVLIRGLLAHGLTSPSRIWAAGPRPERAAELAGAYGIRTTTDNREAIGDADLVVLAVKPAALAPVLRQIRDALRPEHVVVSIVAGARMAAIGGALGRAAIVRCVPNLPCRIGRGLTVWTATPEVSAAARESVRGLLRRWGARSSSPTRRRWTAPPPPTAPVRRCSPNSSRRWRTRRSTSGSRGGSPASFFWRPSWAPPR